MSIEILRKTFKKSGEVLIKTTLKSCTKVWLISSKPKKMRGCSRLYQYWCITHSFQNQWNQQRIVYRLLRMQDKMKTQECLHVSSSTFIYGKICSMIKQPDHISIYSLCWGNSLSPPFRTHIDNCVRQGHAAAEQWLSSPTNTFPSVVSTQVAVVQQQVFLRCRQSGHVHQECPTMDVRTVFFQSIIWLPHQPKASNIGRMTDLVLLYRFIMHYRIWYQI